MPTKTATGKKAYAKAFAQNKTRVYSHEQVPFIPEGNAYPSVTTILSVIAKPMLLVWMQKNGVDKAIEYKETLKAQAGPILWGMLEKPVEEALPTGFWKCGQDLSSEAAKRGTAVHDAIENWAKTGKFVYAPEFENSMSKFKQFVAEHDIEVIESEIALASNHYRFAGRTDIIAKLDGKLAVIDIKTSSGFYAEMGLQLSAYKQAYLEMTGQAAEELWIVRVDNKTGVLETKQYDDHFETFLAALNLWNGLKLCE